METRQEGFRRLAIFLGVLGAVVWLAFATQRYVSLTQADWLSRHLRATEGWFWRELRSYGVQVLVWIPVAFLVPWSVARAVEWVAGGFRRKT
jgi:hypothetical protein